MGAVVYVRNDPARLVDLLGLFDCSLRNQSECKVFTGDQAQQVFGLLAKKLATVDKVLKTASVAAAAPVAVALTAETLGLLTVSRVALRLAPLAPAAQRAEEFLASRGGQAADVRLVRGFYEAEGWAFKFSEYYYQRLWDTGRGAPFTIAREILQNARAVTPDRMAGFYRYTTEYYEMVYNPTTREVWHLQPLAR